MRHRMGNNMVPGYELTKKANPIYGQGAPEILSTPSVAKVSPKPTITRDRGMHDRMAGAGRAALRETIKGAYHNSVPRMGASLVGNAIHTQGIDQTGGRGANVIASDAQKNRQIMAQIIGQNKDMYGHYLNNYINTVGRNALITPGIYHSPLAMYASAPVLPSSSESIPDSSKPGYVPKPSDIKPKNAWAFGTSNYPSITRAVSRRDAVRAMGDTNKKLMSNADEGYVRDMYNKGYNDKLRESDRGFDAFWDTHLNGEFDGSIVPASAQKTLFRTLGAAPSWVVGLSPVSKALGVMNKPFLHAANTAIRIAGPASKVSKRFIAPAIQGGIKGLSRAYTGSNLIRIAGNAIGAQKSDITGIDYNPTTEKVYNTGKALMDTAAGLHPILSPFKKQIQPRITKGFGDVFLGTHPSVVYGTASALMPSIPGIPGAYRFGHPNDLINYVKAYHGRYTPGLSERSIQYPGIQIGDQPGIFLPPGSINVPTPSRATLGGKLMYNILANTINDRLRRTK